MDIKRNANKQIKRDCMRLESEEILKSQIRNRSFERASEASITVPKFCDESIIVTSISVVILSDTVDIEVE